MIGNKIDDTVADDGKITKISKPSQQNNSERVINKQDRVSPEERQKIVDDLRLMW